VFSTNTEQNTLQKASTFVHCIKNYSVKLSSSIFSQQSLKVVLQTHIKIKSKLE